MVAVFEVLLHHAITKGTLAGVTNIASDIKGSPK